MKERVKNIYQWHIFIFVLGIFIFSMLCWGGFIKSIGSEILSYLRNNNEMVNEESVKVRDSEKLDEDRNKMNVKNGESVKCLGLLDQAINKIDLTWDEKIFKKSNLSSLHSLFTYYTLGEVSSNQVILGKEGWLFYKSETDGNPIKDFEGTNRYTSSEMNEILQVARITQEKIEEKGIEFAILVAPNKENVYSEFMPDIYTHNSISSTDILVDYLIDHGINVVSPKKELLIERSELQVYYSYDTHWNQLGAYIGVKSIMDFWNIPMKELSDRNIMSYELKNNYHYCGKADLAELIGLRLVFDDEMEYEVEGTSQMEWQEFEEEQEKGNISHYVNKDASNQSTIFLVGDSFRVSMVPALREVYRDVYVVHRSNYKEGMLEKINPDYLLFEYVERYSDRMREMDTLIY